ncbi:MAG: DUF1311 domain-containing protein [Cyanobacteria bacterium]|nr:DUF1311 domain-containing protein [Cyanobacteria bacterium bin.51]
MKKLSSPLRPFVLLLGTLVALLPPLQGAAHAEEASCSDAITTIETSRCLVKALRTLDQELEEALVGVAKQAEAVPGDDFQGLWRDNLTKVLRTSPDPIKQAQAFRRERRKVCAYAKSLSFQGSGYGIFVTSCEIELSKTLLDQFQP